MKPFPYTAFVFSTALAAMLAAPALAQESGGVTSAPGAAAPGQGKPTMGVRRHGDPMALFEIYDLNNDGKITKEEYETVRTKRFEAADINKDGKVTYEELVEILRPRNPERLKAAFQHMDVNGDGYVTKDEYDQFGEARFFERFDLNKDGVVTREEFQEVIAERQGERAGKPRMRPGGAAPSQQPPGSNE